MALAHPESCIGLHTVNPEVPTPRFAKNTLAWFKFHVARLTFAILRRSSFGYTPDDFMGLSNPATDILTQATRTESGESETTELGDFSN